MGSLRARLIDRNRWSKRYPLIRHPKRLTYLGNNEMSIEVGELFFDNVDTATLKFEIPFPSNDYRLVAVAKSTSDESGNVNIYIDGENTNSTQAVIKASAPFTGHVDVIAIRIGQ